MKHATLGLHILQLTSGRLIVQLIGIVTIPILTRLYLPDHFGVTQILDSLLTILAVTVCWKFEMAIPLAQNDQETVEITAISAAATLITTLLVALLIGLYRDRIASWYRMPELRSLLWFLPVFTLLAGLKHLLTFFASKEEHFRSVATSEVVYSLTDRAAALTWGIWHEPSSLGMLLARLLAHASRILTLIRSDGSRLMYLFRQASFSASSFCATLRRYQKFPLFQIWTVFLNTISAQLPPLLLGRFFETEIVGYYALSARIVALPMTLLRDAITTVSFPMMAKTYQETGSLTDMTRQMFLRLLQIASFPTAVFGVFGVSIFYAFFGEQWIDAGEYARLLAIWQGLAFINLPMKVFVILDRQEMGFLMNILMLLMRIGGISFGIFFNSSRLALQGFVILSVTGLLLNIFWQLRLAKVSLSWATFELIRYAALSSALLIFLKWLLGDAGHIIVLLAGIGIAAAGYVWGVMAIDRSFCQYVHARFARFGKR